MGVPGPSAGSTYATAGGGSRCGSGPGRGGRWTGRRGRRGRVHSVGPGPWRPLLHACWSRCPRSTPGSKGYEDTSTFFVLGFGYLTTQMCCHFTPLSIGGWGGWGSINTNTVTGLFPVGRTGSPPPTPPCPGLTGCGLHGAW